VSEIVFDRVSKRFAPYDGKPAPPALRDISLTIERGELVVIVGPSGCGKSTTLRILAGLEEEDSGTVSIAGRSMKNVAPQDRDVAMVFQGYALYPQMTAREILEFPLKMRNVAKPERARAVDEAAAMLRIEKLLDRLPGEMSGGERQRVAMGRAVVRKPRVFLFDEPLSNLDASLRGDIRLEIGQLVRRLGATAVYVTHDHVEAMTLADRIAVMNAGKLLQCATPREIYERPATSFIATFIGSPRMNLLSARVDGDALVAGAFRFGKPSGDVPAKVEIGVRPDHVHLADDGVEGVIVISEPLGAETHHVVRAGEIELRVRALGFDPRAPGSAVRLAVDESQLHLFDPGRDGARIETPPRSRGGSSSSKLSA
jgi:multiple sugar transport system ATP-binding protein